MYDEAVVIALGSSLGGRWGSSRAVIVSAIDRIATSGFAVLARSGPWRSASWPDPTLPDYINALVVVETARGPRETLAALHAIETDFGRHRAAESALGNAPRILDLDLIAHGRVVSQEAGLILPHPRAAERLFVMGPLAQIAPDWRHPVSGETSQALAAAASVGTDARPV